MTEPEGLAIENGEVVVETTEYAENKRRRQILALLVSIVVVLLLLVTVLIFLETRLVVVGDALGLLQDVQPFLAKLVAD